MSQTLKDVGRHIGTYGNGHYEVAVRVDGTVVITTILDEAEQTYNVVLTQDQWSRLVEWVAWAENWK